MTSTVSFNSTASGSAPFSQYGNASAIGPLAPTLPPSHARNTDDCHDHDMVAVKIVVKISSRSSHA